MIQQTLDGKPLEPKTCGDCAHLYVKHWNTRKYYKCKLKPRGWGYDVKKSHVACGHFKHANIKL